MTIFKNEYQTLEYFVNRLPVVQSLLLKVNHELIWGSLTLPSFLANFHYFVLTTIEPLLDSLFSVSGNDELAFHKYLLLVIFARKGGKSLGRSGFLFYCGV